MWFCVNEVDVCQLSVCKLRESEVLFRCRYVLIIEFFDFVEIPANFESVRI